MTDRPILFSAPMIRALIDGRKSQTRRLAWRECRCCFGGGQVWAGQCGLCNGSGDTPTIWQKVRPGDRLWVRETWFREYPGTMYYRADPEPQVWLQGRWKPSIHMPRCDSRLTLVVTETKMERLQEISEADAKAEGCGLYVAGHGWITSSELRVDPGYSVYLAPRNGFEDTWNSLHKPGNRWEDNPEVVALTFTVHKANIDRLEQAA